MKTTSGQPTNRDRTYKEVEDGDYLSQKQYMRVAVNVLGIHLCFEALYIWLGCTPMVIINIVSILSYVVSIFYIKRGETLTSVWIMVLEVYFHVIFASIFLGLGCGFHLWLFGTVSSIFLPYFIPNLSKSQKNQIGTFSLIIIVTFITLTALEQNGLLPTMYRAGKTVETVLYYFNAVVAFGAIMLYTAVYNIRMAVKSRELQRAADHDFLTGIYNRMRIQRILDAEVLRSQEVEGSELSVAIVDIDFFKRINDTYGHDTGDEALKELTKLFSGYLDKGLLYGRWGGEEFLLIAPENIPYRRFAELLEELRGQVEKHEFVSDGKTVKFTVSIGAAAYEKGMTVENLVNLADDRLYNAKGSGRNKVVY